MADPLADLSAAGVSIWLDDLSRLRLTSGTLHELVRDRHVVGVTSNPTIFANARLASAHHEQVLAGDRWARLAASGARPQLPLSASTGVVNTVPEATLDSLTAVGIDYTDVVHVLEDEGATKFEESLAHLADQLTHRMRSPYPPQRAEPAAPVRTAEEAVTP